MSALTRKVRHAVWVLNGQFGRTVSLDIPEKVTVLITYFHPARMADVDAQIANILKCDFVEKLVISNHNPDVDLEQRVSVRDGRLVFLRQEVRRGCGYRWLVANELDPEFLIVIDDDMLFFPSQLAKLFRHLVDDPRMPHGISGFLRRDGGALEYRETENLSVDYLCETYAVTRAHLRRFLALRSMVAGDREVLEMIEAAADFMVISRTGADNPRIHDVGRLFKAASFKQFGVAVHKRDGFDESLVVVGRALQSLAVEAVGNGRV